MTIQDANELQHRVQQILDKVERLDPKPEIPRLTNLKLSMRECLCLLQQDYESTEYELMNFVIALGERTLREFFMLEYGVMPILNTRLDNFN